MRKWWPLVAVCAGAFMLLVDVTIVNVALPDMARQLHTTFSDLQWVIDLYALALGALVLTVGSVADRLGHRRVYLAGLVLFAASSVACGASRLERGRPDRGPGVQGVGGGGDVRHHDGADQQHLLRAGPGVRRVQCLGRAWSTARRPRVGPVLGGLLTASVSWRLIFLVNLPVSVIAVVMTLRVVTESRRPAATARPHRPARHGVLHRGRRRAHLCADPRRRGPRATTITLAWRWRPSRSRRSSAAERRSAAPMLELRLLRNPLFTAMLLAGGLLSAAAWAGLTYESLWLQSVLGLSPVKAGLRSCCPARGRRSSPPGRSARSCTAGAPARPWSAADCC